MLNYRAASRHAGLRARHEAVARASALHHSFAPAPHAPTHPDSPPHATNTSASGHKQVNPHKPYRNPSDSNQCYSTE